MNLIRKYLLTIVLSWDLFTKDSVRKIKEPLKLSITEAQEYALQNNRAVKTCEN